MKMTSGAYLIFSLQHKCLIEKLMDFFRWVGTNHVKHRYNTSWFRSVPAYYTTYYNVKGKCLHILLAGVGWGWGVIRAGVYHLKKDL